ncbi:hypothetical protein AOQ84DRAFT_13800 [Glonium stellatum]|uniref:Uncharacterized protein n=1 Tax=Glonium stellatum TaxID=574774 RepID=A0A8E2F3A2_9PEZI|nr:hypothetical protein AOQ84DRAFT_13800 [Glonium stellatum]
MAWGIAFGLGTGENLQGTVLSSMPGFVGISLALSSAAHRIMRWPQKSADYVWYCCKCGDGPLSYCHGFATCGHHRCTACQVEADRK